jgi:purine nucleoside phosphorylase
VGAISLVTNPAAGVGPDPLSHEAVTAVAAEAAARLRRLLDALLPRVAARHPA